MFSGLLNWKGAVEIDGTEYDSIQDAENSLNKSILDVNSIILYATHKHAENSKITQSESIIANVNQQYIISVKQYMTKKATPEFDFMLHWNNDNPMPLRTMIGTIEKETPGMVYMKLHGDIVGDVTQHCMKCGKKITNPVSKFFGMGPECGGHNYVSPFESEEELKAVVNNYRINYLQKITWEGWIIKSAILEKEIIK